MSKVKSIFKRSLAILLAVLTLMSVGLTSAIALNLEMAQTAGYVNLAETGASTARIYFENNWLWTSVSVYWWGSTTATNPSWPGNAMIDTGDNYDGHDVYYYDVPTDATAIIINGVKNDGSGNRDQSPNITSYSDGQTFKMNYSNGNQVISSGYNPIVNYTVTFYKADGTTAHATQTVASGSKPKALSSNPTKTSTAQYSYTFKGWSTTNGGTTTVDPFNTAVTKDTKYYPVFTATTRTYTITFVLGNGQANVTQTLAYGSTPTAPADPELEGHKFTGWSPVITSVTGAQTYTAQYELNSYTIDFYKYDSTLYHKRSVNHGSTVNAPDAPVRDGYTFLGWSTDGTAENIEDLTTKEFTSGGSYTAVYEINTYTVTFKDWDGTVLGTQTITYGGSATAPADPSREGHTFTGWDTSFDNVSDNLTVTAKYDIDVFTVDFCDKNGVVIESQFVDWGTAATAPTAPDVPGWTFSHWDTDFSNVKSDLTVTAVYTEDEYTVNVTTNVNGGTASANVTSGIKYGDEVTLTAIADDVNGYEFAGWSISGDYLVDGDETNDAQITITVNSDITVTANFKLKEYEVSVNYDSLHSSSATASSATVEHGSTVTLTAEPDTLNGVQFAGWEISGNYKITSGSLDVTSVTIMVTSDIVAKANFTQLDSFTYTVSASPAEGGTVLPESNIVYDGSSVLFTAVANTGYNFVNWSVVAEGDNPTYVGGELLESPSIQLIPHSNVSVTANFEPITGTVNVTAGEGGTVTSEGENKVTYPTIVTSTATGDASNDYEFTHWTVVSDGKVGTDYKVTENDNVIEVQILTQDTVVNVTANFANAQKIKVYTYSDSGFNRLTVTESNGTTTNTPVNNVTQSAVTFGEETWYTPGEVTLTAGFSNKITAQMSGDNPLTSGTGTLIMFKNTLGWDTVYFYGKDTSMYKPDVDGSSDVAVSTTGVNALPMKQIGTSQYYYIFAEKNYTYKAFSEGNQGNYSWFWQTEASYPNKGNSITGSYSSSTPCFAPSTTKYWANDANSTSYYNNGSWVSAPSVATQTDPITITSELYDGNVWKGVEEIWIYFKADGSYIATTKDRRELIDEVNSALMKRTYNNGVNDMEYTSSTWTAFVNAYEAAIAAAGDPTLSNTQLEAKHSALTTAYNNLKTETNITITGSHGAEPKSSANVDYHYGTTSFLGITTSSGTGNIGDQNDDDWYHYKTSYIYATIERGTTITINTDIESTYENDYLVYGWVVNGTEWVPATQDVTDTSKYVGTYKCDKSATFVPIYFRKTTIANWETDDNIVKIYASTEGASSKWGNYISAYTWMNDKNYYQFGHWTGQLMIPDTANPGMYYTYLEFKDPAGTDDIAGIAFTNYGANKPINEELRYQTYDYYEFKELKELGYNNIVFQLKTFEGNENYPSSSGADLSNYQFDYFRDFSGNMIDITRTELTDEQKALDPELYIVRTGPVAAYQGKGYRHDLIAGSDYYVDTYVYDKNGNYLVGCKSFELLDLDTLATNSKRANLSAYAGKPVMVDYASLTYSGGSGENRRFDGEWYGTIYGLTNVTIKAEVAFQNEKGEIQYFQGQNNVDGVGQAYINGEHIQEVPHGSEGHNINAIVADGNDFVGWYKATVADDGSYTIDATADPLIVERSTTIQASADAVYVAVFKEHPEGTFTVNNYYYTYKDFEGYPMSDYLPPVFGGDTSYSIRDVKIHKIYDAYTKQDVSIGNEFAGTYTQSMENISVGDKLEITIKTTPTYPRDYVYAWYILAPDSYGVNFEEIGTNVIQNNYVPGESKEFTFTYTVEAGVNNITIYSDVVHITPEVTFTYIYNNRYNETKSYVVKHTLTDEELKDFDDLNESAEFKETIRRLAPYVGDIYKNVTWEIDNISSDATNWTLRATEADIYTVNVNVNGEVLDPPITGRFNETVSIYAKDIDETVTGNKGIWYLDTNKDDAFTEGVDEILGLGSYYGLVITGNANVCFTNDTEVMNQIILADAVYGYERATDGSGNVTINKVYVDYLISMLLNVYTGGYIDCNNNKQQDIDTEPTIIDEENTNTPVSLKAIEKAGYKVDYGMVHELLNTFGDNKVKIKDTFYGKDSTAMSDTNLTNMLISGSATEKGATYTTEAGSEMLATLLYKYSAIAYEDYATNKNRVIMTFGYDNTDYYRNLYYNVKAYLTISAKGTETMTKENTMFVFSNSATLNIAEDDKITNGEATNS